jgi:hypothetical protein
MGKNINVYFRLKLDLCDELNYYYHRSLCHTLVHSNHYSAKLRQIPENKVVQY